MKTLFLLFSIMLFSSGFAAEPSKPARDNLILINTIPKSGSVFINDTLQKNLEALGYSFIRISQSRFHDDYINENVILSNLGKLCFTQEHIDASPQNIDILSRRLPKFVLHFRDPRQALLSFYHHVENVKTTHYHLWSKDICPPLEYFSWNMEKKLDWQIEHYLPAVITWMQDWCKVIDTGNFNILVTTFEEMVDNTPAYFRKIFDFYNIKVGKINYAPFKPGQLHQRKGEKNEWERVFNSRQKQRIAELVPVDLLNRFGWNSGDEV